MQKDGKLFVVPTPIGNLEDITLRALRTLKEVDIILAEDTRQSKKLLTHFEIHTPLHAHHMHNEKATSNKWLKELLNGKDIALISDAGTPGISDPGFYFIRHCIQANIEVICLPGATALIPAIVCSGLPCDKFMFEGFFPQKKGREKKAAEFAEEPQSIVFYESPHRILKTLAILQKYITDDRPLSISREISKIHEEHYRGNISGAIQHFTQNPPKGEFVVVLGKV